LTQKINCFGGQNLPQRPFSFFSPEFGDSFSLLPIKNDWKKRKTKLGTKIYCLEIQEIDLLLPKTYMRLKWMFQQNIQPAPYVTLDFHFNPLAFNSILLPKKLCNWGLIWAPKGQIARNKSLRIKVNFFFKKYTTPIHNELWERAHQS
jgi:hypothetical protein